MTENENLVQKSTENVDVTTEQIQEKTYTEAEFNQKFDEAVGKKIARNNAKIRKEYDKKYGELINVLKAGTGKEDVTELTDTFKQFYQRKGIDIPQEPKYSKGDIEVLARADANEIINMGFEDVVEEVDRLADLGASNMTAREKAVFKILAEHRQNAERGNELSKAGVTEDVYNSKEFNDFASKFNSNTPITDIYNIYKQTQPKKEIKTMGSMKNSVSKDTGIKDYYTPEEARQFTQKDFDNNPALFKAVEESSYKWK